MYADVDFYKNVYKGSLQDSELGAALAAASAHIDTLTFNRIRRIGFANLTPFQQGIIQMITCRQADFEVENRDVLESVLSQYSINGVSMSFGSSWNVAIHNGVAMQRDAYELLKQTGLTRQVI